jgi:membrane-associated phospholipid phosphatase
MRRKLLPLVAAVSMAWAAAPRAARGEEAGGIVYDLRTDAVTTAVAASLLLGSELLVKRSFALDANWTRVNGLDSSVKSQLEWSHPDTANTISWALVATAPVAALGLTALAAEHDGRRSEFLVDTLLIAEATAIDGALNQLVKFTVRRARPCGAVHSCPDSDGKPSKDDNLSFYSEHSSLSFALAASAGTVARLRGYRWAPAVWIGTAVLGAATAYLRIAANEHYFTDVLTGAAVGTAVGVAVPYWLHRPRGGGEGRATVVVLPTVQGGTLGGTLTYALRW